MNGVTDRNDLKNCAHRSFRKMAFVARIRAVRSCPGISWAAGDHGFSPIGSRIDRNTAPVESGGRGPMTQFFEKRDPWGNRYSLWILALMAFAAPLCWWSIRQTRLENDVESWLSENDAERRASAWAKEQFPIENRILLTWDGSSINDPRVGKLVEQLAGKLDEHGMKRGGLPYISSVTEPLQSLDIMQRNGIEPHEAVQRLEGTILGAGPLRLRLTETGRSAIRKTKRELQTAMKARFGLDLAILDASPDLSPSISIPAPAKEGESAADPSAPAILNVDGSLAENASAEHDLQVAWKGMRIRSDATIAIMKWFTEYLPERGDGKTLVDSGFFAPGSPVALSIGISEAGLADKAETIGAIRLACKSAGIPSEALHLAGEAISSNELNDQVIKSVWDRSFPISQLNRRSVILASAVICTLLAFVLLRSMRLATMVLFVAVFATFCSLAIIPATDGAMNMVVIAVPSLILVIAMSCALHVANYWRQAACVNAQTAALKASETAWRPTLFGCLAIGFCLIALCTSKLIPIREFGFYGAVGTGLALMVATLALPSLIQIWSARVPREQDLEHQGLKMLGQLLTAQPGLQALVLIAICVGCAMGLTRLQTETNVIRYFPESTRLAQDYWNIETSLAGVMPVETIIRFDSQSQKDTNFLERMELVRKVQEKLRAHPEVSGSTSLADFEPVSERPAEDANFLQRTKYNKRAAQIQQRIRDGEIPNARSFYTIAEQGRDMHESGDAKLNQAGDELWRLSTQINVMTDHDLGVVLADVNRITQDVLKLQPGSQHLVTGTVPISVKTQREIVTGMTGTLLLSLVLTMVVLMIALRSISAGMLALIANTLPIAAVFGVMSWLERRIDVGSMMTASIALGITVHGMLNYVNWFQILMREGRTRREAIVDGLAKCSPVIWQCGLVGGLGFLVMISSDLLLLSRFGGLMAALIGAGVLANSLLIPQLLGSFVGVLFEPAKVSVPAPIVTEVAEVASPPMTDIAAENTAPAPHIKPLTAPKKRRSSSRRDSEAG